MGRQEAALARDGSAARELAYWLRAERRRAGLTYTRLAELSRYSASSLQEAAAGRTLPTLELTLAFVRGCGGDEVMWRGYWLRIKRYVQEWTPGGLSAPAPSWAGPEADGGDGVGGAGAGVAGRHPSEADTWYLASLDVVVSLDGGSLEAIEHRVVVAAVDGLSEIAASISLPRGLGDRTASHDVIVDLLHGGVAAQRQHPYESYFRTVIELPRPLRAGERHRYTLRVRVPPKQPLRPYYVHVPHRRSDLFRLTARFPTDWSPRRVVRLDGLPTAALAEIPVVGGPVGLDAFGETSVEFTRLRQGLAYGIGWQH